MSPTTLHIEPYRTHVSIGCLHIPPNGIRMLLCINPVKKEEGLFSGFSEKSTAGINCFHEGKKIVEIENLIPAGAHTSIPLGPNRKRDLNWGSNVQWKSESPGKTQ